MDERKQLMKLLMTRAMATIPLIHKVQNEYQSTERLYKRGMVTEDVYNTLKLIKDFVNEEYQHVTEEGEELAEGFGQTIWQQANRYRSMLDQRQREMEGSKWADDDDDEDEGAAAAAEAKKKKQQQQQQQQQRC